LAKSQVSRLRVSFCLVALNERHTVGQTLIAER